MVIIDYPSISTLSENKLSFKDQDAMIKKLKEIAVKFNINFVLPSKGDHADETSTNK